MNESQDEKQQRPIRRIKERLVYRNEYIELYDDDVEFRDGSPGKYVRLVESNGRPGVAALAICNNQVGLVKTFRYPVNNWEWGIPRGFGSDPNPDNSMRKELDQELGREPDVLERLGVIRPNSGLLAGTVVLYLAHYRVITEAPKDQEVYEILWLPAAELHDWIVDGLIVDAFTLSAVGIGQLSGALSTSVPMTGPSNY